MSLISKPKHLICALTFALLMTEAALALDAIPEYEFVDIGSIIREAYPTAGISSGWAVNESGDVVGAALIDGYYQAFIFTQEWGLEMLPPLPGWTNNIAQDVSDRDADGIVLIAGGAGQTQLLSNSDPGHSTMWLYDTAMGVVVETVDVGHLPGQGVSELTAVNNNGLAVGYSRLGLTSGPYLPMVYDVANDSLQPLTALSTAPVDINNLDEVLAGTDRAQLSVDPVTGIISVGSIDDLSAAPGRVASGTSGLNDIGWASGVTSMGYGDGAGRIVKGAVLYSEESGPLSGNWDVVWANSAFDVGHGLNIHGDVVGNLGISSAIRAALFIRAVDQVFLLSELSDPPAYSSSARDVNDTGWITGGGASAVLWKRIGDLPVPTPPANLTAVTHEPTGTQPWNAISLAFENTSTWARSFTIERSVSGANSWSVIRSNWSAVPYNDTSVDLGVTYDYRVSAEGLAGFSSYSNIATATAPATAVDTEPPSVAISNPVDGEQISGRVTISVVASDNVAVTNLRITYSGPSGYANICTGSNVSVLNCTWNTKKKRLGPYTLTASASDAMRNASIHQIFVELVGSDDGGGPGGGGCKPKKKC